MLVDVDARNSDNPVPVPVPLSSMTDNGHYDDCVEGETRSIQGPGDVANWSSLFLQILPIFINLDLVNLENKKIFNI